MCPKHQTQMVLKFYQNPLKPKPKFIVPVETEVM